VVLCASSLICWKCPVSFARLGHHYRSSASYSQRAPYRRPLASSLYVDMGRTRLPAWGGQWRRGAMSADTCRSRYSGYASWSTCIRCSQIWRFNGEGMLRVALSTTKEKDRAFDIQFNSYTRQSDRSQREGVLIIYVSSWGVRVHAREI